MSPHVRRYRALLAMSTLVSSLALAQGTSTITGTVTDAATGKPVPDVVVTATSPALQGEQIVVTDSAGLYRLAQLPAGVYLLKLEKESFKPYSRPDINVRVDRTVRVNVQLQPESVTGDTVVVVGRAPTVDVGSTTTGLNVGKEFINNIAFIQPDGTGVRSFESLASVAPQVAGDTYGYGFSGAQSPENLYVVDGVSVGDPAFGTNGARFPVEFVQEANVVTGGYMAEYGRATGGVLNVVTKSGSNEFHGTVWGNWTPGALSVEPKTVDSLSSSVLARTRLGNTLDFGAEVGGPIIKDRLWFLVGFAPSFNWDKTTRSLRALGVVDANGNVTNPELPGSTRVREESSRSFSYIAKLTYLLNSDNNLSLSVVGSPTSSTVPFSFSPARTTASWNGGSESVDFSNTVSLKYNGAFLDKHLLVDASLGWFHIARSDLPNDGSTILGSTPGDGSGMGSPAVQLRRTSPHFIGRFESLSPEALALCQSNGLADSAVAATCPATGSGATYNLGGLGYVHDSKIDRIQARASVSYLFQAAGHHTVKAGVDVEQLRYDITKAYTGGFYLRESTSGNTWTDLRQYGSFTGPDEAARQPYLRSTPSSTGIGAFLQDSWSIMDVVTLNAGLRYENQQLFAGDGALGLSLNNMLSPRVGLIYDFTQQGRSKLFANFARYYESVPINIADRGLTGEDSFSFIRYRTANSSRPGCDPITDPAQAHVECQDPANYYPANTLSGGDYDPSTSGIATSSGRTPVDPNIKPQSSDEFVVGGEYEVIDDGRVGVTYTRRYMNQVIEDMSVDEASSYFLGNPGSGWASLFPKATRDYDAVTAYFTKAFSEGWMAQFSYTWSSLRGNYNGLFRPETGQLDPNLNSDFDLITLLPNRTGYLEADRTHALKAFASKEFRLTSAVGLVVGLSYTGRSGAPINYFGSHPIYGTDEAFVLPRGSGGRMPWVHAVNGKVGVSYRLNQTNEIQFTADIFNMFNFQAVTAVDQTLTTSDVAPFQTTSNDPQTEACLAGNDLPQCKVEVRDPDTGEFIGYQLPITGPDGTPLTTADLNPNFKRPTAWQQPISVRFGLRFTF